MRWQTLYPVIAGWKQRGKDTWSVYDVAAKLGISTGEASWLIQGYFASQRNKRLHKRPPLAIHRMQGTRTRNAMYQTGEQIVDARDIIHSLASDLMAKASATARDLRAVTDLDAATASAMATRVNAYELQTQAFVASLLSL